MQAAGLYLVLGFADLAFSVRALRAGVLEGNPLLAWAADAGWFLEAKVLLTLLTAGLMLRLRRRRVVRVVGWCAVGLMGAVNGAHLVGLWRLGAL